MSPKKLPELLFLVLYLISCVVAGFVTPINYVSFIVLYGFVPALFFALRLKNLGKLSFESLVMSVPFVVTVEHLSHLNRAWYVPGILGYRVFNTFPVDEFIFGFIIVFFFLSIYEYFFDHYRKHHFNHKSRYFYLLAILGLALFSLVFWLDQRLFLIPYFYTYFAGVLMILATLCFWHSPRLWQPVWLLSMVMFLPSLMYEVLAIKLGYWQFEVGRHVGYITLGTTLIPLEEIAFIIFAPLAILTVHELWFDNGRAK